MEYTWLGVVIALIFVAFCFTGFHRGFVKEAIFTCYTLLAVILVGLINPYVDTFLTEQTPLYEMIEENCLEFIKEQSPGIEAAGKKKQKQAIEALPLPSILKEQILENNNEQGYELLNADSFIEYAAGGLAGMLVKGIGFALSFVLVSILIHTAANILNIVDHIPLLRQVNRIAGMLVGGFKGILVIWVAMLVLTIFCNTSWGAECMGLIEQDILAKIIYEYNPFITIFMSIF